MKSLRFALSILTSIPSGLKSKPDDTTWLNSVYFFPLCGYILASFTVIPFVALSGIFYIHDLIQAIAMAALLALLTGGIHLDGFADACDSLLCSTNRDKRVEIMHDSRIGAFGAIGLIFIICSKISALFLLIKTNDYMGIFCIIVIARFMLVFLIKIGHYFPYEQGMGKEIIGKVSYVCILIAFIYTAPCIFFRTNILITTAVLIAVILYFNNRVSAKMGGISGDILGASVELCETLGLVFLTIKPY